MGWASAPTAQTSVPPVGAIHESPVDMAALQLKTHKAGGGCLRLNVRWNYGSGVGAGWASGR